MTITTLLLMMIGSSVGFACFLIFNQNKSSISLPGLDDIVSFAIGFAILSVIWGGLIRLIAFIIEYDLSFMKAAIIAWCVVIPYSIYKEMR